LFARTSSHPSLKIFVGELGQGHRNPGLLPYINFVLEEIILKLDQRIFAIPDELARMTADALEILNKCLELVEDDCRTFLLNQSLPQVGSSDLPYSRDDLVQILSSPGFQIICRILKGSKITKVLFDIIRRHDVDTLNSRRHDSHFGRSLITALAIVYRILNFQALFLNEFIPRFVFD
jgi:nuclear pore complex protein Nup205